MGSGVTMTNNPPDVTEKITAGVVDLLHELEAVRAKAAGLADEYTRSGISPQDLPRGFTQAGSLAVLIREAESRLLNGINGCAPDVYKASGLPRQRAK